MSIPDRSPSTPAAEHGGDAARGLAVRLAWWVGLLALVAHWGFVPGVSHGVQTHAALNYDDPQVLALARERSVDQLLTEPTYYAYKPVYFLSLKLDLLLDQDGAGTGHVVNLLLFALACVLLVRLLSALTRAPWVAAAAGVLLAVHPAHVESVAWIAGRKDVLSLVLALAAHLAYRRARARDALPLLAPLLLLLAGLTKGTVWTWAGLFVVDELIERRRGAHPGALARLLPSLLVGLAGIALDAWIGVRYGPGAVDHGVGTAALAAAMAGVHLRYLLTLLAPVGLTLDHDVDPGRLWSAPATLLGAGLALLAVVLLIHALRRGRALLALALAFWILGLAPVNNVWPRTTTLMAERYLLVGAIGPYLLVAWLIGRTGGARAWLLGAVALLLGVLCVSRTNVFRSSESVWADALDAEPGSALAWVQRAQAAAERHERANALAWSREALVQVERRPRVSSARVRVQAHLVACAALAGEGRLEELLAEAGQAGMSARAAAGRMLVGTDARKLESQAEVFRGQALEGLDQPGGAREAYARAAMLDPGNAFAHYNLATLLAQQPDERGLEEALRLVKRARQLQPGWLDAGLQHAKILAMAGRAPEALALYKELEGRHGAAPELLLARAQHHLAAGPADRALADLERLRREHPDHPKAARLVYDLYVADARRLLDEARREGKRDGLPKALERLGEAQKAGPDWTDAWLLAGDVLYEQGKLLEARERYRRALTVDGNARWIRGLAARATVLEAAWLARRAQDPAARSGAARLFAEALREGAERIDLGLVPLELELPLLGLVAARLQADVEPARAWSVSVLVAAALLAAGDDGRAEAELGRVIGEAPQEQGAPEVLEAALMLRAGVSDRAADTEAAARDYALLARLRPKDPAPRLRLLQVELRATLARRTIALGLNPAPERLAEAEATMTRFASRPPDAPPLQAAVAREVEDARAVVRDAARFREAEQAVLAVGDKVIAFADASPTLLEAGLLAVEAEMSKQRWVEALKRLNGLAERFPAHPAVLRGQATVYINQYLIQRDPGLVHEALLALHKANQIDPRDPRTALATSGAYRIRGSLKEALQWAMRARAYENLPGGPAARELAGLHVALGEQALEGGDRVSALKAVAAARGVEPAFASAWVLEGRVLLESADAKGQRDFAKALEVLMKAKELEPANLAVDRLLSKAYHQRGYRTAIGLKMLRDPQHPAEQDSAAFQALTPAQREARVAAWELGKAEQEAKRAPLRAQAIADLSSALRLDAQAEHAAQAQAMLENLTAVTPAEEAARAKRAMEALARGAGHLAVREFVDAYLDFEEVLRIDPNHRKASFYLVQAAYERLVAGSLSEEERRAVTSRAFERLQALDTLDAAEAFPPRHLYRAYLNEALFRRAGNEDARQAAIRAYDRYLLRAAGRPETDPGTLESARRRREELQRLEAQPAKPEGGR